MSDLLTSVEEKITKDVSPYRLSVILSDFVGYVVRPQMMYGYVRQNLITSYKNEDGKITIDRQVAIDFVVKFTTKNSTK